MAECSGFDACPHCHRYQSMEEAATSRARLAVKEAALLRVRLERVQAENDALRKQIAKESTATIFRKRGDHG